VSRIAVKKLIAIVPALILAITACGSTQPAATSTQKAIKVALILPCPTNDGSWCQQAYIAA
jgi:basic membrane lipoprotein Med (substrate-binding protein (PBP1-ABC) superfamily)